jgi:hypothetical protein
MILKRGKPMPEETIKYDPTVGLAKIGKLLRNGIVPAPGKTDLRGLRNSTVNLRVGQFLRDRWLQQFPLLPDMVSSFSQVAVSREWTVTGTPARAARSVERLNNAVYVDENGLLYEGWSAFTARRVVDWLTLGRYAMLLPSRTSPLQYVDPVEVTHQPAETRSRVIKRRGTPNWKDFHYAGETWGYDQLFQNHYLPIGAASAMSPLVPAIPLARLLYLVEQHDMASVDGRKIKDIFIVADDNVRDALIDALHQYAVMQSEDFDPSKHGIPIVAANKRGGSAEGERVEDLIALLGISKVPDGLDREALWDQAAISFSALSGMQVTEWYHIRTGAANRATERVNQERGRTKGANYFVRQDQRFINNSGIMGRTVFAYTEEVDVQAQKDRAEVMLRLSEAVKNLSEAIGMAISPRAMVRWLQQLGVFPTDDYLVDDIILLSEDPVKPDDMVDVPIEQLLEEQEQKDRERQKEREMEEAELAAEKQRLIAEAQQSVAGDSEDEEEAARSIFRFVRAVKDAQSEQVRPIPEYGEVTVNQDGFIVDRRLPIYPVASLLKQEAQEKMQTEYQEPDFDALEAEFDHILNEVSGQ